MKLTKNYAMGYGFLYGILQSICENFDSLTDGEKELIIKYLKQAEDLL